MFVDYATFSMPIKVLIMVVEERCSALPLLSPQRGLRMDILVGLCWVGILCGFCDSRMRPMVLQNSPFFPVVFGFVLGVIQIVYDAC
jgi:hypothetical protein